MKTLRKAFTGEESTESDYVRQVRYIESNNESRRFYVSSLVSVCLR